MVAPKTENVKYDLSVSINEKDLSQVDTDEKPFTIKDFQDIIKSNKANVKK